MFGLGIRLYGYFCVDCEKRFESYDTWARHEYIKH